MPAQNFSDPPQGSWPRSHFQRRCAEDSNEEPHQVGNGATCTKQTAEVNCRVEVVAGGKDEGPVHRNPGRDLREVGVLLPVDTLEEVQVLDVKSNQVESALVVRTENESLPIQFPESAVNIVERQFGAVPTYDYDLSIAVVHQLTDRPFEALGKVGSRLGVDTRPGEFGPKSIDRRRGREDMNIRVLFGEKPGNLQQLSQALAPSPPPQVKADITSKDQYGLVASRFLVHTIGIMGGFLDNLFYLNREGKFNESA